MSAYFQRLMDQSGVRIRQPIPEPAVSTETVVAAPVAPLFEGGALIEAHEERDAETPPLAWVQPEQPATSPSDAPAPFSNFPGGPPAILTAKMEAATGIPVVREITTFVEETVVLAPAQKSVAPPRPSLTQPSHDLPSAAATPVDSPRPSREALPADVLQAVMSWIGAESAPSLDATAFEGLDSPPSEKPLAPVPERVTAANATPPNIEPVKVPERVIEILETPSQESKAPGPMPVSAWPAAAPSVPFIEPSAEAPARISIGSIHVRVEAPPSPTPPSTPSCVIRPNESARSSTIPPRVGGGFSKLRRHYILPH